MSKLAKYLDEATGHIVDEVGEYSIEDKRCQKRFADNKEVFAEVDKLMKSAEEYIMSRPESYDAPEVYKELDQVNKTTYILKSQLTRMIGA